MINVMDASPTLITGLFYLLVSREWFPIYTANLILSFIAFFLAFICPESPRWLLYNGRQDDAIEALNYMAKFNGSSVRIAKDAIFQETLNLKERQMPGM